VNFKKERFVVHHAKAGVGCVKCHGFSDDHSSDEDNITPPEKMFTKAMINPNCLECHRKYKKTGVVCAYGTPGSEYASIAEYCSDCHGDHRLAVRTRRWDKVTGKLTYDDGVRMVRGSPGKTKSE
jgi:L-asparaginase II